MRVNGRYKDSGLRWALTPIWTALGIFGLLGLAGIRINWTSSLPPGFYLITDDLNARLVEFCPPRIFSPLSIERGYRPGGICPDREAPLLKPVIATPGDTVMVSDDGISVNGRQLPNTRPRPLDSAGRPLKAWPPGIYSVSAETVWVASTYHPNSLDSRYFGPISISTVRHRLRPLWTVGSRAAEP